MRTRRWDAGGRSLAEVGEEGLLGLLVAGASGAGRPGAGAVLVGPGDDAAVWVPPPGEATVVTQDVLVEDVDFRRSWSTPYGLGRRALTVSLSDLAAMGARPGGCVVAVCAPASTAVEDLEALQLGLAEAGTEAGCALLGGDVSSTAGPLVVDVCALGSVDPSRMLRRDAGHPGEALVVTGSLGRAAAGLRLLEGSAVAAAAAAATATLEGWRSAHLDPVARLAEGRALAAAGVACAGDVSDGLLVDAARTAAASGCAAELWLDAVPVEAALVACFGDAWPALALGGGEDFELLAAVPADRVAGLLAGWRLTPLRVVGRLVEGAGLRLLDRAGGAVIPPPATAARHFG